MGVHFIEAIVGGKMKMLIVKPEASVTPYVPKS